jgi:hypothetical protein
VTVVDLMLKLAQFPPDANVFFPTVHEWHPDDVGAQYMVVGVEQDKHGDVILLD